MLNILEEKDKEKNELRALVTSDAENMEYTIK